MPWNYRKSSRPFGAVSGKIHGIELAVSGKIDTLPKAELADGRDVRTMNYHFYGWEEASLLHQGFTGIPGLADLATGHIITMLELIEYQGINFKRINFAIFG